MLEKSLPIQLTSGSVIMAPTQVRIIPIQQHKEGVLDKVNELYAELKQTLRVDVDDSSEKSPGYKFNEAEMLGIPARIEVGPRDLQNNQVTIMRPDTLEKEQVSIDGLAEYLNNLMEEIQKNLFEKAKAHRESRTTMVKNMDEFKTALLENPGFIRAMHCECEECEEQIKAETAATLRCFPFHDTEQVSDVCVNCGKPAKRLAYFARAY